MLGRIVILSLLPILFALSSYAADCNGGRYENMTDGTVTDCRTGLIWLKNAKCTATSGGIPNPTGYLNYYHAVKWVAGLGNNLCGLTDGSFAGDWRLPTKTEWMAMIENAKRSYTNPTLTNAAGTGQWSAGDTFDNVQSDRYHSSTIYVNDQGFSYYANLSNGVVNMDTTTGARYVWPVRAGQDGSFGALFIYSSPLQ